MGDFAERWAELPTLGFTHYQPAQLTTVGKRACLWASDLLVDLQRLIDLHDRLRFRVGQRHHGDQASFFSLGDAQKVEALDQHVAELMGFDNRLIVCGQTYSRKVDPDIVLALASWRKHSQMGHGSEVVGQSQRNRRTLWQVADRLFRNGLQKKPNAI